MSSTTTAGKSSRPQHPYKAIWKQIAAEEKNTAAQHAIRCLLKGTLAKDPEKEIQIAAACLNADFTPITNPKKIISNSKDPHNGLRNALIEARNIHALETNRRMLGHAAPNEPNMLTSLSTQELMLFGEVLGKIQDDLGKSQPTMFSANPDEYVYIFVRTDSTAEQIAVQAAHATMALGSLLTSDGGKLVPTHGYNFVLIGQPDEQHLSAEWSALSLAGIGVPVRWKESDGSFRAFTTVPLRGRKRRPFDKYQTLRFGA